MWKILKNRIKNLQKLNKFHKRSIYIRVCLIFKDILCDLEDSLQKQFSLTSQQRPYFFLRIHLSFVIWFTYFLYRIKAMLARLSNSLWFLESQKLRSEICVNLPTLRITTYNFDKRHFYYRPSTILSKNFATILFHYFSPQTFVPTSLNLH